MTIATTDTARWDLPAPADATRVYPPQDGVREFDGTARKVRNIGADITGWQMPGGETLRSITVGFASAAEFLTADEARQLAAVLVAAAGEVEHLHTVDGPR